MIRHDQRKEKIRQLQYKMCTPDDFDFDCLSAIRQGKRNTRSDELYNDCIIMADTETSKKYSRTNEENAYLLQEWQPIADYILGIKYKWNKAYKSDIATYQEFIKAGFRFATNGRSADSVLEEIADYYKGTFEDAESDIDAMSQLYDYISEKPIVEDIKDNHVVAWTISIRAEDHNIVTLYGHDPESIVSTLAKIQKSLCGTYTLVYFHNLTYDWVFLRKFMIKEWGEPEKQLNTKPHYPINIQFENGIILRDSLILAQRSLERWASDLQVEHQKAVGKWDYNLYRNQSDTFTDDELEYIEHDTLAGVECLQSMCDTLGNHIYNLPYTATGIVRREVRKRAKKQHGHDQFKKICPEYDIYTILDMCFHGGYTHANRYLIGDLLHDVYCYDFTSSYPFVMLSERYPVEKFTPIDITDIKEISDNIDEYAFIFRLTLTDVTLKDVRLAMPVLQYSKAVKIQGEVLDNGRILSCDYIEIYLTEIDLQIIADQYVWKKYGLSSVYMAKKGYLPRWYTDYVYECYNDKCKLKGGDPVLYAMSKSKVNSLYGMSVQKPIKPDIIEDYETGEQTEDDDFDAVKAYDKYVNNRNNALPYQYGVYVTAYAMRNLFKLGKMCKTWVYSDTDSCYMIKPDVDKINAYNAECIKKLEANGYKDVVIGGKHYSLGVATHDGLKDEYDEFKTMGAKRYCGRCRADGELHITVAGVPKKLGAKCLHDNIDEFREGKVFDGETTKKKMHTYIFTDDIYEDENGNKTGDSINLEYTDYLLSATDKFNADWDVLEMEGVFG